MTADRDDLAAILAKHTYDPSLGCVCGGIDWRKNAGPMKPIHRAHVAQMVLESDWLRDVKADVWDKCEHDCNYGQHSLNPYRPNQTTGDH